MQSQSQSAVRVSFAQGVGVWPRLLATIVDGIIIGVLISIIDTIFGGRLIGYASVLDLLVALAYYAVQEALYGATLGKRLLRLRVVRIDGRASIGWSEALLRTIMRLIDVLPFFYLVGAISIWTTLRNQRLGDLVARTLVVRE
jgi:Predicted membrane protein/domain